MKHWSPAEIAALQRLRVRFLERTAGASDYWGSAEDLALYDRTFAERIGWKIDAVLGELAHRRWRPVSRHLLDWGCGSGVASRRVLEQWPGFASLALHDRSPNARKFAAQRAREVAPGIAIKEGERLVDDDTLLVLSHVVSELDDSALDNLLALARRAREILWVESGTFADSRRLIAIREELRGEFHLIAPCTHRERCGLLAPENAPHWCHHFAHAPSRIFQDARWMEWGREMGIDLRSLPYAFLVLSREAPDPRLAGFSRIIGRPTEAKGYSRVLSCQAAGVNEWILQKRDAPELLRRVNKAQEVPLYRWEIEGGKIRGGTEFPPEA